MAALLILKVPQIGETTLSRKRGAEAIRPKNPANPIINTCEPDLLDIRAVP
jgi:hypothetical protein